jgi:twitching motility protein PilT
MAKIYIDRLLETAVKQSADLYLTPGFQAQLRLNGKMRSLQTKVLTTKDIAEIGEAITPDRERHQLDEHGSTVFSFNFGEIARFRVTVIRYHHGYDHGYALALRFHPPRPLPLEELQLPHTVPGLCRRPRGLFLIIGPQASGKTTLLASIVDYFNRKLFGRILTIERSIEFVHVPERATIVQRELGTHVKTVSDSLADIANFGADAVVIDDLQEPDTILAAVELAYARRLLVFAGMSGQGTVNAVRRLTQAPRPADRTSFCGMLSESLVAVLYQELCSGTDDQPVPAREFLVVTPNVSKCIREQNFEKICDLMQSDRRYGMQLIDDELFRLAVDGSIARDEAIDRSANPGAMADRLEGPGDDDGGPLTDPSPARPKTPPGDLSTHADPESPISP